MFTGAGPPVSERSPLLSRASVPGQVGTAGSHALFKHGTLPLVNKLTLIRERRACHAGVSLIQHGASINDSK